MSEEMHRYIGAISFKDLGRKKVGKGSGILISPNLVLTAAHNLLFAKTKEKYADLVFYPGHSGILEGGVRIIDSYYPKEHEISQKPCYDYALLKLEKDIEY